MPTIGTDLRSVDADDLAHCDAVIHLAGISNDPVATSIPNGPTISIIGHRCAWRSWLNRPGCLASCFHRRGSLYGASGEAYVDESAPLSPVTPYGHSKQLVEQIWPHWPTMISARCSCAMPRYTARSSAPAYRSGRQQPDRCRFPQRRGAAHQRWYAVAAGLVHVQDVCRAFLACLEAPREAIHNQSFNIGGTTENYQIRDVAKIVQSVVDGSRVVIGEGATSDIRNYRVDCSKFALTFPDAVPRWTVRREWRSSMKASSLEPHQCGLLRLFQ